MTLKLKTRLTLLITLLVLFVLSIVSIFTINHFAAEQIRSAYEGGDLIGKQIYGQVKQALMAANQGAVQPSDPEGKSKYVADLLSRDVGLKSLLESTIGNSPILIYLAVTDPQNHILLHSDSFQVGQVLPHAENFLTLKNAPAWEQLRTIYGPLKNYEVIFEMMDAEHQPFGTVHVAMSTALIREQLRAFLRKDVLIAGFALLIATTLAAVFAQLLLRPLTFITAGIEQLIHGEFKEPIRLKRGDEFGLVSLRLNEIGQRLEGSQEELDKLRDNFGQIVQSLEERLIFVNAHRQIILISPSVAQLLNTTISQALGQPVKDLLGADHPLSGLVETAFALRKNLYKAELQLSRPEDKFSARIHYLSEDQQSMGVLVILEDPETVARLESQLEYAKKLSALSRLTSGVAHEVKNPLNAIVIHLELLRTQLAAGVPSEAEKSLAAITAEIRRLDRVVRYFLNFTRPMDVTLREEALPEIIQDVVDLAAKEASLHSVEISVQCEDGLPLVKLDRDLMKQCLLNLIQNGYQAMPQGGTLRVLTSANDRMVQIRIQDEGVGISPANRDKIFDLYYTTKENGNGIGLATVFKIVQLHDGEIQVDSEPGKGSAFTLRFPLR
ncbi:MAG: ATP-binding protein [Terriglobia bacterium]